MYTSGLSLQPIRCKMVMNKPEIWEMWTVARKFFFSVLGIQPKSLYMLGLHSQSSIFIIYFDSQIVPDRWEYL